MATTGDPDGTRRLTAAELLDRWKEGYGPPTLVGSRGGRCVVNDIWRSDRMFGYVVLETEFGLLYADGDALFLVIR